MDLNLSSLFENDTSTPEPISNTSENVVSATPVEKSMDVVYQPRFITPMWFMTYDTQNETEAMNIEKHRGDAFYFQKKYEDALAHFKKALELVPKHNNTLRRELLDSIARCSVKTNDCAAAIQSIETLECLKKSIDHTCAVLTLRLEVARKNGQGQECISVLHQLLVIHPHSVHLWRDLANQYVHSAAEDTTDLQLKCLQKAKKLVYFQIRTSSAEVRQRLEPILTEVHEELSHITGLTNTISDYEELEHGVNKLNLSSTAADHAGEDLEKVKGKCEGFKKPGVEETDKFKLSLLQKSQSEVESYVMGRLCETLIVTDAPG